MWSLALIASIICVIRGQKIDDVFTSCFHVPNSLCFDGNSEILSGPSAPADLVAWWSFDRKHPVDESGNGNHLHPSIRMTPSFTSGHAAVISASTAIRAISSESMNVTEFTVMGWIYLLKHPDSHCNIISKGTVVDVGIGSPNQTLSVDVGGNKVETNGKIPLRRWTHFAVAGSNNAVLIYLNGAPDAMQLPGSGEAKVGDVVIGASSHPAAEMYIDDVKLYRRALSPSEISSSVAPEVTGLPFTDIARIGCTSCNYTEATDPALCIAPFHLCYQTETYMGSLHLSRIQGWSSSFGGDVWFADLIPKEHQREGEEKRMALCCGGPIPPLQPQVESPGGRLAAAIIK